MINYISLMVMCFVEDVGLQNLEQGALCGSDGNLNFRFRRCLAVP